MQTAIKNPYVMTQKQENNYDSHKRSNPDVPQFHRQVVAICIVIGLIATAFVSKEITLMKLNRQINTLNEENRLLTQEIEELQVALQQSESLRRIEEVARTKLGMVFPGDERIIVKVVEPEQPNEAKSILLHQGIKRTLNLLHQISSLVFENQAQFGQ